jgi:hypothetical protein
MPENYRLMMDYEYNTKEKKEEIHKLKHIPVVFEIYIVPVSIRFQKKIFCLWLPTLEVPVVLRKPQTIALRYKEIGDI